MVPYITQKGLGTSEVEIDKVGSISVSGFGCSKSRTKNVKETIELSGLNNTIIKSTKLGSIEQSGFCGFNLVPTNSSVAFEHKFDLEFDKVSRTVIDALSTIQQDANNIKSTVLDLSTNLNTNYLSKAELTSNSNIANITSAIKEQTATFVTNEQAGGWYGLSLETDVNGKKYVTGFDIGSLVYPNSNAQDSYFRINADRFIVGGDIGDGKFTGPVDEFGEPIPAFSITQLDNELPQMYFNGKVNISSIPTTFNKFIGSFPHISELTSYLAIHTDVVVNDGDSYKNTTENVIYFWDGSAWISAEAKLELRSFVFKRSATRPDTPIGGDYRNTTPDGWSDGIPESLDTNLYAVDPVWVSTFMFDNKTDYVANPPQWDVPEMMIDIPGESDLMYHNSETPPPTPLYTGDETSIQQIDINNGWQNTSTVNTVWFAHRKKSSGVWTDWYVYRIKGEDGNTPVIGVDYFISGSKYQATLYKEVVNGTNPSSVALPTGTTFNGTNLVSSTNGWTDDPVVSDATGKYLVVSIGLFDQNASTGNWALSGTWSTPQKYTIEKGVDFFDGASGTYTSYIYKVGTSVTTPSGGSFSGNVSTEVMPSGWVDNPSYGIDDVVWVSSVVYQQSAAGSISWEKIGNWSTPTRFYVRGNQGATGATGATGARGSTIARIYSTSNSISYYASNTYLLSNAIYAIVSPAYLQRGDQVIVTASNGTEIFEYNSGWTTNTALRVNGNAIIDGTLYANKLASNAISGQTISIRSSTNAVGGTTPTGSSSLGLFDTSRDQNAIGAVNRTSGGYGVSGIGTNTSSSVGVHGRGVYGVLGETIQASGYWGLITQQRCYAGQGFSSQVTTISFTGGHTCFANTPIREGDILEVESGYLMTIDQSYTIVTTATTDKSKRVFGVASKVSDDVEANLRDYAEIHEVGDDISTLGEYKEEYKPFIDNLINNNYKDVTANSIGEGGINVCSINGDIENGDYITSSDVAGKGMKQDDDLLHNYTVAKALESVIWDDEIIGEGGCFEQDGYKCKMIACTYHAG